MIIACLAFVGFGCKPPGARALFNGEKLLQTGNAEAAVAEFERAVQILPEEWRAWNYLGLARHRAGDLERAGEAYQEAVKIAGERWNSPNDFSFVLYYNQGRLNLDRDRLADAQRQLHTFASQKQTFKSLFWLAESFRRNGDVIQAQKTYLLALDKNNNSAVAHNRLGLVHLKLKNHTGAISSFKNALELKPEFDQAQLNLALTYHRHTPADFPNRDTLALEALKTYFKINSKPAPGVQEMLDALQAKLAPAIPPSNPLGSTNKLELVGGFTNIFPTVLPSTNLVIEVPAAENTNAPTVFEVPSTANLLSQIGGVTSSKPDHPSALSE